MSLVFLSSQVFASDFSGSYKCGDQGVLKVSMTNLGGVDLPVLEFVANDGHFRKAGIGRIYEAAEKVNFKADAEPQLFIAFDQQGQASDGFGNACEKLK